MIYFITGSKYKFEEVKAILPGIEQLKMDLPEIQELDPHKIIQAKLEAAFVHSNGEFIVEDTSVYMDCLEGFPGPLIKWLQQAVGNDGLVGITEKFENSRVIVKTIIGHAKNKDDIRFFEGTLKGSFIRPAGESDFGWDSIFLPDGHDKTFAEMSLEEKNAVSMRGQAAKKLKEYLSTN